MSAGKRNKRITFEKLIESRDSAGGLVQSYTTDFSRWASLLPVTGNEKYISDQLISEVTHKIGVLFDSKTKALTHENRATKGDRVFNIKAVLNVREENADILILAKEVIF